MERDLPWVGLIIGGISGFSPGILPRTLRILVRAGVGFLAGYGAKELMKSKRH